MNRHHVEQVLTDLVALTSSDDADRSGDDHASEAELSAVTIALTLEDVFAIRLTDADIDAIDPRDPVALAAMLDRVRGQR
jgi:hypothetical protein